MTRLADATWPGVESATRRALLVPVGSCEQHGLHLPLDTDTRIARAVAERVARATSGVWVAPAIAIGASGEHAGFPGTLSIGTDALVAVVVELVRDASRDWPCVLLVNGHGGNVEALGLACARLEREGRRCIAWTASSPGGDAHAGMTETSLMLALDATAVDLPVAEAGERRPIEKVMPNLRRLGVRAISPNGVLGDPTGASAEEGRTILEWLVGQCAAALRTILAPD